MFHATMIYRTNDDPEAPSRAAAAREIMAIADAAEGRRRRTGIAIAIGIATVLGALFVLPPKLVQHPTLHCHTVEQRWENAPEIPANRWRQCEWR